MMDKLTARGYLHNCKNLEGLLKSFVGQGGLFSYESFSFFTCITHFSYLGDVIADT